LRNSCREARGFDAVAAADEEEEEWVDDDADDATEVSLPLYW
jgi:U3 small nucleolar RNA-associated protein 14